MEKHNGEKLFIISIIKQAFVDILNAPDASCDIKIKYRTGSKHFYSSDAKRFINKNNMNFIYYCTILDLEPWYAEKKFNEMIKSVTSKPDLLKVIKNAL